MLPSVVPYTKHATASRTLKQRDLCSLKMEDYIGDPLFDSRRHEDTFTHYTVIIRALSPTILPLIGVSSVEQSEVRALLWSTRVLLDKCCSIFVCTNDHDGYLLQLTKLD